MADEIVTTHTEETVTQAPPPETATEESEEFEVTQQWVESLFAQLSATLAAMEAGVTNLAQSTLTISERLMSLENRVPENLVSLVQTQQAEISKLVSESMETVRSLLTPPAPAETVTETPAEESVVVAPVEVAPSEPARRKRRLI